MLDEAAIHFTKTFYVNLFKGNEICRAFDSAKRAVSFKMGDLEANLFTILLEEDIFDPLTQGNRSKKRKH